MILYWGSVTYHQSIVKEHSRYIVFYKMNWLACWPNRLFLSKMCTYTLRNCYIVNQWVWVLEIKRLYRVGKEISAKIWQCLVQIKVVEEPEQNQTAWFQVPVKTAILYLIAKDIIFQNSLYFSSFHSIVIIIWMMVQKACLSILWYNKTQKDS